ncbi:hypothetical protein NQ318_021874 [Aromia moschata]|uniref:Uncharacterized protein n=1 Tax=Aromia moschata TaxID=1265417 RepID=A0AAV8Z646_9CUCU|nr:hypothetical protein NQ318_021874 [Aromia moschata]
MWCAQITRSDGDGIAILKSTAESLHENHAPDHDEVFWEPSLSPDCTAASWAYCAQPPILITPPIPVAGSRVRACIASPPAGCCNLLDKVWGVHIWPAFCDLRSRNHTKRAAHHYVWGSVSSSKPNQFKKSGSTGPVKNMHSNPQSMQELLDVPEQYTITLAGEDFLLYDSSKDNDICGRILIFETRENLRHLMRRHHWYLDVAFKVVPMLFFQLFAILASFTQVVNGKEQEVARSSRVQQEGLQDAYNNPGNTGVKTVARTMCGLAFMPVNTVVDTFDVFMNKFPDEFVPLAELFEINYVKGKICEGKKGRTKTTIPSTTLEGDLKDFLDGAKDGFIYFSLGSNVKSKELAGPTFTAIFEALKEVPLKVLWKFEDDNLPGKPEHIKIMKWVPQRKSFM